MVTIREGDHGRGSGATGEMSVAVDAVGSWNHGGANRGHGHDPNNAGAGRDGRGQPKRGRKRTVLQQC